MMSADVRKKYDAWFWALQAANAAHGKLERAETSEEHSAFAMEHWRLLCAQRVAFQAYADAEALDEIQKLGNA